MRAISVKWQDQASNEFDKIIKNKEETLNSNKDSYMDLSIDALREKHRALSEKFSLLMNKKMELIALEEKINGYIRELEVRYANRPELLKERIAAQEAKLDLLTKALHAADLHIKSIDQENEAILDALSKHIERLYSEDDERNKVVDEAYRKIMNPRK